MMMILKLKIFDSLPFRCCLRNQKLFQLIAILAIVIFTILTLSSSSLNARSTIIFTTKYFNNSNRSTPTVSNEVEFNRTTTTTIFDQQSTTTDETSTAETLTAETLSLNETTTTESTTTTTIESTTTTSEETTTTLKPFDVNEYYKSIENEIDQCKSDDFRPRILCWILIRQTATYSFVRTISRVWANKCDRAYFVISKTVNYTNQFCENELRELENEYKRVRILFIRLNEESIAELTPKMIESFKYVHANLMNDFDWFFKADDDTYVLTDNLRRFIRHKCPNETHTYGRHFKLFLPKGYLSGGSGYLVSREAIRRLGDEIAKDATFCTKHTGDEDVDMANCLAKVNVYPGDSRDELKRERFHPEPIERLWNERIDWLVEYQYSEPLKGPDCCSESSIAFHRLSNFVLYDFLLYKLQR